MKNEIQKGKMLTLNIFTCFQTAKHFHLSLLILRKIVSQFEKKTHHFKPLFYYFDRDGECMLKKEEVQRPSNF